MRESIYPAADPAKLGWAGEHGQGNQRRSTETVGWEAGAESSSREWWEKATLAQDRSCVGEDESQVIDQYRMANCGSDRVIIV